MTLVLLVRPADVATERSRMLAILREQFSDWRDDQRFDWLYLRNPWQWTKAWLLVAGDRVVGISSGFARQLDAEGRLLNAWVLGDFCVARDLRSLGPALALQRAACDGVDAGEVDLFYDFPSRAMAAVYQRLGLRAAGEMVRMVSPLTVDRYVQRRSSSVLLRGVLTAAGNAVLSARRFTERRRSLVDVQPRIGEFELQPADSYEGTSGVRLVRSAEYLNWRYLKDPRGSVTILGASRDGREDGFVAFRRDGDHLAIIDAFAIAERRILRELVLEVVEIGCREKASGVTVGLSDKHPWLRTFRALGFRERDRAPFFVYSRAAALRETPWFLMDGDRDL